MKSSISSLKIKTKMISRPNCIKDFQSSIYLVLFLLFLSIVEWICPYKTCFQSKTMVRDIIYLFGLQRKLYVKNENQKRYI